MPVQIKSFWGRGSKRFSVSLVALAVAFAMVPYSSAAFGASQMSAQTKKEIAFSFPYRMVDIYKPLIQAAKAEAKKEGFQLLESSAGMSAAAQLSEVNTWIAEGVGAIVLFSLEPNSMAPTVAKAHAAGVKIIGYAEHIPGEDGSIVFNNAQGASAIGTLAAKYINAKLGGKAEVGVLSVLTGAQNRIRTGNAVSKIKQLAPGAKFVAQSEANDAGTALKVMRPMLAAHPKINVIIANTDDDIIGVAAALKGVNRRADSIWFASYDGSTPVLKQMLAGSIKGVTANLPTTNVGRAVVSDAANAISGHGSTTFAPSYVAITSEAKAAIQKILTERGVK